MTLPASRIGATPTSGRMGRVVSSHRLRALTGVAACALLWSAAPVLAAGNNNPAPTGAILDLGGGETGTAAQPVNHGAPVLETVTFTARLAATDLTFAFRDDPSFFSVSNIRLVNNTIAGSSNLLANGNFSGGTTTSNGNASAAVGWTFDNVYGAGAAGRVSSCSGFAGTGNCWYDGAIQAYDAIDQIVHTTVGDSYTLSFYYTESGSLTTFSDLSTNGNTTGTGGNGIDILVYAGAGLPPAGFVVPTAPPVATPPTGLTTVISSSNNGTPTNYSASLFGTGDFEGGTLQISSSATIANNFYLGNAPGNTIDANGNSAIFTGAFYGAGGLTIASTNGGGLVTFSNSGGNIYTGATFIQNATLQAGAANALSPYSAVTLANSASASLNLNNFNQSIGGLSGGGATGGNVALGSATLAIFGGGVYGGVISGSGAIVVGSGNLVLTNANTYTGGTTVYGGTLEGSATSFGSGAIAIDSTLTVNQLTSAAFANVLTGYGSFYKIGSGTLDLTGTSLFSGGTTVAQGALQVSGSLANSTVTVASNAVLAGNGTVGGVVAQANSRIVPGPGYTTLTVAGNYQQNAGSTLQIALTSAGSNSAVNVQGAATLAGGAMLDINELVTSGPYPWTLNERFKILTAANGLTGTFRGVTPRPISMFYTLQMGYDATHAYFDVAQTLPFKAAAITPNQAAAAAGLNSATVSQAYTVIGYMNSAKAAQTAFTAISGEAYASARTVFVEDSRFVRDAFVLRLQDAEDPAVPATTRAAYGDIPSQISPLKEQVSSDSGQTAVWAHGFGSWGSNSGDGNASAIRHETGGLLMGVDTLLADFVRVGVGGGYSKTSLDVAERASSGSSDNFHLGLYAGARLNGFGLKVGASYTWNELSMARTIAFPGFFESAKGAAKYSTAQLFGDLSYRYGFGAVAVEPFDNLAYVDVNGAPFVETGGSAALQSESADTVTTYNTVGTRGFYSFNLGSVLSTVEGSVGWKHAFGVLTPQQPFNFAGGSVFTVAGAPIAQDALAVKGGLDFALTESFFVAARYDGQFAKTANDQSVKGAMAYKF
jgi:outer membrane autotransporter protein